MKGYKAADFLDSWDRYIPRGGETSEAGKQTASGQSGEGVQDVPETSDVTGTSPPRETFSELGKANDSDVSLVSLTPSRWTCSALVSGRLRMTWS